MYSARLHVPHPEPSIWRTPPSHWKHCGLSDGPHSIASHYIELCEAIRLSCFALSHGFGVVVGVGGDGLGVDSFEFSVELGVEFFRFLRHLCAEVFGFSKVRAEVKELDGVGIVVFDEFEVAYPDCGLGDLFGAASISGGSGRLGRGCSF